jgi:hypothetical protein
MSPTIQIVDLKKKMDKDQPNAPMTRCHGKRQEDDDSDNDKGPPPPPNE